MILHNPPIRILATILARNEEDILAHNIEHHIQQGISQFIITNNASVDRTRQIAEKYPEVVEIIDEPNLEHRQSEWVTRMARLACKFHPDWIVHLDADEFWCGLQQLQHITSTAISSTAVYLHPPRRENVNLFYNLRYYLDFENILGLHGECKIAHRPDPNITIAHGNHGIQNYSDVEFTNKIWRHHYPIRSGKQFIQKTVNGHRSLLSRNAVCERWEKWYNLYLDGKLVENYYEICDAWENMLKFPNKESLLLLLNFWSTPEAISLILSTEMLPLIGEWPKGIGIIK